MKMKDPFNKAFIFVKETFLPSTTIVEIPDQILKDCYKHWTLNVNKELNDVVQSVHTIVQLKIKHTKHLSSFLG